MQIPKIVITRTGPSGLPSRIVAALTMGSIPSAAVRATRTEAREDERFLFALVDATEAAAEATFVSASGAGVALQPPISSMYSSASAGARTVAPGAPAHGVRHRA